jgi:beta-lactamase superfamily II metal-dependent hydrolase
MDAATTITSDSRAGFFRWAQTLILGITTSARDSGLLSLPAWLHIEMSPSSSGNVEQYPTLISEPTTAALSDVRIVPPTRMEQLKQAFSFDSFPRSSEIQIRGLLERLGDQRRWVAAFDVGQGACNALVSDDGPDLYFDFGGGVLGNRQTFPKTLERICTTKNPVVILSHWDWDHWSSLERFPEAFGLKWLVPDQKIDNRPTHLQVAAKLAHRGNLFVWSRAIPPLTIGDLELALCNGRVRNDSGIAVAYRCRTGERALLPGDARYGVVPIGLTADLSSVVVPHHGAKCAERHVPKPSAPPRKSVFSYGAGNTYGHASAQCRTAHSNAGWNSLVDTAACNSEPRGGVIVAGQPNAHLNTTVCGRLGFCPHFGCDLIIVK